MKLKKEGTTRFIEKWSDEKREKRQTMLIWVVISVFLILLIMGVGGIK